MKKSRLIFLTVFFVFTVLLLAWFALQQIKQEYLTNIKNSLKTVVHTTHEGVQLWIQHRQDDLLAISHDDHVITLIEVLLDESAQNKNLLTSYNLQEIRRIISTKIAIHHDLGFYIINKDNMNVAASSNEDIGVKNYLFQVRRNYAQRVFAGETLFIPPIKTQIHSTNIKEKPAHHLLIATPLFNNQQEIVAILAIQLDPSLGFTRVTQLGRIGETGETYIFNEEGVLITNSRFDKQLKKIGLINSNQKSMLSIKIADPGGNLLQDYKPIKSSNKWPLTLMAKKAVSGLSGVSLTGYRDYRGVPVFGAWLWDIELDIGLATEIDVDEALYPYYKTRLLILFVVLMVVFLAISSAYVWLFLDKKAKNNLEQVLQDLESKVNERTKELQELSYQDGLTNVANRRMFDQCLEKEWRRGQRSHQPLALIMIDIDCFKAYNDNYGHLQGDECLKIVANALASEAKRSGDLLARYGGEEFALLLPNTTIEQALIIAKKCHENIKTCHIKHEFTEVDGLNIVSISLGVSVIFPTLGLSNAVLVEAADKCLYIAKRNGRNRVEPTE